MENGKCLLIMVEQIQLKLFSLKKTKNITYPYLYFNNVPIIEVASQKHLGLNLDAKLTFKDQIHDKLGKSMKSVSLLCRLQYFLLHFCLLATDKPFIRPHVGYGDVMYDQPSNVTFSSQIEFVQYLCCNSNYSYH